MKKLVSLLLLTCSFQLSAITSNMTHRVMGTSPLLYSMINYSQRQTCYEVEPIYSSMYDTQQVIANLMPLGKATLILDQQGSGDINPVWLNLMASNTFANYYSTITFTPKLVQSGALFHWYEQFDSSFFDVKTALVQCKSEISIEEIGGGNGLNPGILNAQQAFTQNDWNYGKIGESNHTVGLDNAELRFGKVTKATSSSSTYDLSIAGFGLIEAPTGTGTKAEWLFEPQVGTNHWGLGFGFEALISGDDDLLFMIAANYRYLTPAWETRSFDLFGNGPWSRYLSVQDTYGLPIAPATLGLPGINYFTQQAYINGRSELNIYTRLAKQFRNNYFELSYNFFCIEKETIGAIKNITPGYGIYALTGQATGLGGVTTSSTAKINQDVTPLDPIGSPSIVTTQNFDKASACSGTYATNTLTARLEIKNNNIIYGFGTSIESALSASAISTWSVWAQFGFLFDTITTHDRDNNEFASELYDIKETPAHITYHPIIMDKNGLPQDIMTFVENDIMEDKESFEFEENNDFNFHEYEINAMNNNLHTSEVNLIHNEINNVTNETLQEIDTKQLELEMQILDDQNQQMEQEILHAQELFTKLLETIEHDILNEQDLSMIPLDTMEPATPSLDLQNIENDMTIHNLAIVQPETALPSLDITNISKPLAVDNISTISLQTGEPSTPSLNLNNLFDVADNKTVNNNITIALDDITPDENQLISLNFPRNDIEPTEPVNNDVFNNHATIDLQNHAVVIQAESGLSLEKKYEVTSMTDDEIINFLHQDPMHEITDEEILNLLDNTK